MTNCYHNYTAYKVHNLIISLSINLPYKNSKLETWRVSLEEN